MGLTTVGENGRNDMVGGLSRRTKVEGWKSVYRSVVGLPNKFCILCSQRSTENEKFKLIN